MLLDEHLCECIYGEHAYDRTYPYVCSTSQHSLFMILLFRFGKIDAIPQKAYMYDATISMVADIKIVKSFYHYRFN